MKRIFTTLWSLLFTLTIFSQDLADGDILFTYVFSDSPKNFGFIALKNIAPNQTIYFTDNAFLQNNDFASNEGSLLWTCPDTGLSLGTQVDFIEFSSQYLVSHGQVSKMGSFNLSASGDQLLAYQASEIDTTFLAAINWGTRNSWITSGVPTTAQSYLPSTLSSRLDFGVHRDNGVFNCQTEELTITELKSLLLSVQNWSLNDEILMGKCDNYSIYDPLTNMNREKEENQVFIYPNPSLDKKIYFSEKLQKVQIVSMQGHLLMQERNVNELNLSGLEQGTYLLISESLRQKIILD